MAFLNWTPAARRHERICIDPVQNNLRWTTTSTKCPGVERVSIYTIEMPSKASGDTADEIRRE